MNIEARCLYKGRMEAELEALRVRPNREWMAQHHDLGDLAEIGHTLTVAIAR